MVVQELRENHSLSLLLSITHLPRTTFYYHLKRLNQTDKYEVAKSKSQLSIMKIKEDMDIAVSLLNCISEKFV